MDQTTSLRLQPPVPNTQAELCDAPDIGMVDRRIRVLHIVPDLRTGGAEMMLARLINQGDEVFFKHQILSMRSRGDLDSILEKEGVAVDTLDITGWLDGLLKLKKFRKVIRDFRPNIVHTWLYHAN